MLTLIYFLTISKTPQNRFSNDFYGFFAFAIFLYDVALMLLAAYAYGLKD